MLGPAQCPDMHWLLVIALGGVLADHLLGLSQTDPETRRSSQTVPQLAEVISPASWSPAITALASPSSDQTLSNTPSSEAILFYKGTKYASSTPGNRSPETLTTEATPRSHTTRHSETSDTSLSGITLPSSLASATDSATSQPSGTTVAAASSVTANSSPEETSPASPTGERNLTAVSPSEMTQSALSPTETTKPSASHSKSTPSTTPSSDATQSVSLSSIATLPSGITSASPSSQTTPADLPTETTSTSPPSETPTTSSSPEFPEALLPFKTTPLASPHSTVTPPTTSFYPATSLFSTSEVASAPYPPPKMKQIDSSRSKAYPHTSPTFKFIQSDPPSEPEKGTDPIQSSISPSDPAQSTLLFPDEYDVQSSDLTQFSLSHSNPADLTTPNDPSHLSHPHMSHVTPSVSSELTQSSLPLADLVQIYPPASDLAPFPSSSSDSSSIAQPSSLNFDAAQFYTTPSYPTQASSRLTALFDPVRSSHQPSDVSDSMHSPPLAGDMTQSLSPTSVATPPSPLSKPVLLAPHSLNGNVKQPTLLTVDPSRPVHSTMHSIKPVETFTDVNQPSVSKADRIQHTSPNLDLVQRLTEAVYLSEPDLSHAAMMPSNSTCVDRPQPTARQPPQVNSSRLSEPTYQAAWPAPLPTSPLPAVLAHMTSQDDVVLLAEEHPLLNSALRRLHGAARSLQLAAPVGRLRWSPTMPPAKSCVLWLHDTSWKRIHSTRPARLLRRWGNRCRRMLVVEPAKNMTQSVSRKLLRFDQAETVSAVMISEDLCSVQVFAHTIDCVNRSLLGTRMVANATATSITGGMGTRRKKRAASGGDSCGDCSDGGGRPIWFTKGRDDLRGHTLRVATTAAVDTIYARYVTENGRRRTVGVEVSMLKVMSAALGFRYTLVEPTDLHGLFGQEENGSWTGVIGMVVDGEADMAIGDISVTLARSRVVDVTYPFHQEPVSFMLRRPPLLPRWITIAAPFDAITWSVLAVALVMATLLFAAVPALSGGSGKIGRWTRLTNAGFVVWATITGQDQVADPRHGLGRCVALLWVIFSVIIGVYYQTMLVSKLSVPVYGRPINSLEDLALSPFKVKSASGTAATVYLESFRGADTPFARLPEKMSLFPVEDLTSSTATLDSRAAYINELGHLQHALKDREDRHLYYISRARFFQTGLAWQLRKGACFARRLNTTVMRLLQSGIVELWLRAARIQDRPESAAPRALTVGDMAAALLVLTVGGAAATLVFVLELVLSQRTRRAQKEAWSRVSRRLTRAQAPWSQRKAQRNQEMESEAQEAAAEAEKRQRY